MASKVQSLVGGKFKAGGKVFSSESAAKKFLNKTVPSSRVLGKSTDKIKDALRGIRSKRKKGKK